MRRSLRRFLRASVVSWCLMLAPGCSPAGNDDHDGDLAPSTGDYATVPNSADMIEQTLPDGDIMRFAPDQIVLFVVDGTPRSDVDRLASDLGGRIIGQAPDLNFYQLEVPTTTQAELDAIIAQATADPIVVVAEYNHENHYTAQCPARSDCQSLDDPERCALRDIEYYELVTQFDAYFSYVTFSPVFVAIIDTGVDTLCGEFDLELVRRQIINLDPAGGVPTDPSINAHGTAVAGMIAANDNDIGVNGIATRVLYDRVWLLSGTSACLADSIVNVKRAGDAGADIVNLSFDLPGATVRSGIRTIWRMTLVEYPNILFVAAAGDGERLLTGENSAPGGLDLPNVITVGGSAQCAPMFRSTVSNYGPGVNVYAPSRAIATVRPGAADTMSTRYGTSFAAPQVSALAAVLKSINPDLNAQQIKNYITDYAFAMADPSDGLRMVLTWPIGNALLDVGVDPPVSDWLDPLHGGGYGPTDLVMTSICGGFTLTVNPYPLTQSSAPYAGGSILAEGFEIMADAYDPARNTLDDVYDGIADLTYIDIYTYAPFALGSFEFAEDASETAVAMQVDNVGMPTDGSYPIGDAISGTITFDSCLIDERHPITNTPLFVVLSGSLTGQLQVLHGGSYTNHAFSGTFENLQFDVEGSDAADPQIMYLESHCTEGGR